MTPEELDQICQTEREAQAQIARRVNVCLAAGCLSCQSQGVKDAFDKEITARGLEKRCQAKGVGCMGLCSEGPLVSTDSGVLYKNVGAGDAGEILDSLESKPVERLLCPTNVPKRRRLVRKDRDGKEQGHEGIRPRRARDEHWLGGSPDGHNLAGNRL
jgi:bidirectional [NiFe] hydrogenase diaphorase subunit